MRTKILFSSLVAALLVGCGKPAMPEVNEKNCELGNASARDAVRKIEDIEIRKEFIRLCSEKYNRTKKSLNWLELLPGNDTR
jgi:entry exclusion lipoprotein TrbK